MSAESLATIMATSGTAIAAAYQPPPCASTSQDGALGYSLANPPRNSIVTSSNLGKPVLYLDEEFPVSYSCPPPPAPAKRQKAPRAIRKTAYSDARKESAGAAGAAGPSGRLSDLMAMEKYLDSPHSTPFLDDFVFDNSPSFIPRDDLPLHEDRPWPPRSVDTSPSSSVSAISPIGTSPFWPASSASSSVWSPSVMPLDRSSPLETSLVDVFEKMRPFSFY